MVGGSRWRVRKSKRDWLTVERFSVRREERMTTDGKEVPSSWRVAEPLVLSQNHAYGSRTRLMDQESDISTGDDDILSYRRGSSLQRTCWEWRNWLLLSEKMVLSLFLCKPLFCNGFKNQLMYLANLSYFITS